MVLFHLLSFATGFGGGSGTIGALPPNDKPFVSAKTGPELPGCRHGNRIGNQVDGFRPMKRRRHGKAIAHFPTRVEKVSAENEGEHGTRGSIRHGGGAVL
jgi:hypothetical protein